MPRSELGRVTLTSISNLKHLKRVNEPEQFQMMKKKVDEIELNRFLFIQKGGPCVRSISINFEVMENICPIQTVYVLNIYVYISYE